MNKAEKTFLLEYEKLCRKHGLSLEGGNLESLQADRFLRWGVGIESWRKSPKSKWMKRKYLCDVFFNEIDPELIKMKVYDDDFSYILNGKIKQYKGG